VTAVQAPGSVDIVVPTVGRRSLGALLAALADGAGPAPGRIFLVDDRRDRSTPLVAGGVPPALARLVSVVPGGARGPAAARNAGWRASRAQYVAFLDDDVLPAADWRARLADDLRALPRDAAASQGSLQVPLPEHRRPTDWERNVKHLETARWVTADMVYRRAALEAVGGFDERFRHAYREDVDLALRVTAAGWRIERGTRTVVHPVRPAGPWASVRVQVGNGDDVLMWACHGARWRERAGAARGRRPVHLATSVAGVLGLAALLAGRRSVAAAATGAWLGATLEFAWARIAPGPRTPREIATMLATSGLIKAWLRLAGTAGARRTGAAAGARGNRGGATAAGNGPEPFAPARAPGVAGARRRRPQAVLLDRDGTLVVDVPHNGDPALVVAVPGAREALDRLRAEGVRLAVVSNQSGVGRRLISVEQVHAVNRRIADLLGPLGPWLFCPHAASDGCDCRKPAPGLVHRAAAALGVRSQDCAVIGDTGADVEAALAAGARPILVPTAVTRRAEIEAAPEVARDLGAAVDLLLGHAAPLRDGAMTTAMRSR
jgi:histidinol-phosphate phosphatase family protein